MAIVGLFSIMVVPMTRSNFSARATCETAYQFGAETMSLVIIADHGCDLAFIFPRSRPQLPSPPIRHFPRM